MFTIPRNWKRSLLQRFQLLMCHSDEALPDVHEMLGLGSLDFLDHLLEVLNSMCKSSEEQPIDLSP